MTKIKLHQPLLETVQEGLGNIFQEGSYADKEVQKIIRSKKQFGSKDRAFIAETIYDIVRWKNNYASIIKALNLPEQKWTSYIFVSLMKRGYTPLNPERIGIDIHAITLKELPKNQLSDSRISFPEWLNERCYKELGESWNRIAEGLNIPAKIYVRSNTLKTTTEQLLKKLNEEGIVAREAKISGYPYNMEDGIEILSKNNLRHSALYTNGWFEFQDLGSQAIGSFCGVQRGQTVLDLCAGAGGKTLQLSALMQNTGKIYATDYNEKRLENLEKRMQHAGCKNITIIPYVDVKNIQNLDLLLIDAPCSGLGTIKRHPDIKWKLKEEYIQNYISLQEQLLSRHLSQVKSNGKIVYATCSILPSESEQQIAQFLDKNPSWHLKEQTRIDPSTTLCDGFYMASIIKE